MHNRIPPPGSCPINGPKPMDYFMEMVRYEEYRGQYPYNQKQRYSSPEESLKELLPYTKYRK
ncbi:MAG: hypothetical protein R6V53_05865 [Candidatus Woesearchaeota archaeon]